MSRGWLAWLVVAIAVYGSSVFADETSERVDLLAAIDRGLKDVADSLPDASRALSAVDQVARDVDRLRAVKGDDAAAARIVDTYPSIIERFRRAAGALGKLKGHEGAAQRTLRTCETSERELQQAIEPFVDRNDPEGIVKIPELATAHAAKAEALWRALDTEKREVDSLKQDIGDFSDSDGRWSDVQRAVATSNASMHATWIADYESAAKACADLRAGVKSPRVEKALAQLSRSAGARDQILKEAEERIAEAAQLLYGAEQHADDSRVQSAKDRIAQLASLLSALSSARGADQRAGRVVDTWPRHVAAFDAAAEGLRQLKRWQFMLDTAPAKCAATERDLADFLAKQVEPRDIAAVQAEAERLKLDTEARFAKIAEQDREMEAWNRTAQSFQVDDGKWTYLGRNLRDASDAVVAYWRAAMTTARQACGDLALGAAHPKIAASITMLVGRVPPPAAHGSVHDSTCKGVPANGACTQDDQCLDGSCKNHRCEPCVSQADGRCHPPGTCSQRDFDEKYAHQHRVCGASFRSSSFKNREGFPCRELEALCNAAYACMISRDDVMSCFKGGDTRHREHRDAVKRSYETCEALLREKRAKRECTE